MIYPGLEAAGSYDGLFYTYGWLSYLKLNGYPLVSVLWNLALLAIPYLAGRQLEAMRAAKQFKTLAGKIGGGALGLLWLVFFPNAAYIITDVRHLSGACPLGDYYHSCLAGVPAQLFFFALALVGWVSFVYFLRWLAEFTTKLWGKRVSLWLTGALIPVTALGVLLGLIERWNSWQVFLAPWPLIQSAWTYVATWEKLRVWLIFCLFLAILYYFGLQLFAFSRKRAGRRRAKTK